MVVRGTLVRMDLSINLFFDGIPFSFVLVGRAMNSMFSCIVLLISSRVFMYSYYYIRGIHYIVRFRLNTLLFVMSILVLVNGGNFLTIVIGWDGLGVSSYFLVIFYMNWKSNNSGSLTIFTNRLGDIFFIFRILFLLNTFSFSFTSSFFLSFLVI